LGSGAALGGGRALLTLIPAPDPNTPTPTLERLRRFSPDPERRREASLLLLPRQAKGDLAGERRLLRGQGWGGDELGSSWCGASPTRPPRPMGFMPWAGSSPSCGRN
jgi:soluble lytic murein transglycosylase